MIKAIQQMLNSQRGNFDLVKLPKEYFDIIQKIVDKEEQLKGLVGDKCEVWKTYKQIADLTSEMSAEQAEAFYCEGFKFGMLMGFEVCEQE